MILIINKAYINKMESNSNSKLKAITGSKNMMGLYDKNSSFKKELKIKKC